MFPSSLEEKEFVSKLKKEMKYFFQVNYTEEINTGHVKVEG